ncbi:MAG TPA: ABC transporter substrate-binding protein [Burkholderiales bacterium]
MNSTTKLRANHGAGIKALLALALGGALNAAAWADINVGVIVSATGPASVLGIPERNTIDFCPTSIGGEKINYTVYDDATNPGEATKVARKLVTENGVDLLIGSSSVPGSLAILEVAYETKTPQLAIGPVPYTEKDKDHWLFRLPQPSELMAAAEVDHMNANGIKKIGFIGYADSWGESFLNGLKPAIAGTDIKLTAIERYNRTDTSVTGQALKIIAARPQAVVIVGSGTPAALPQTTLAERGYKGLYYQSHGAVSPAFLRVAGEVAEGTIFPIGPIVVAEQLPDSHPSKKIGLKYKEMYEAKYGKGSLSPFGAHMYDGCLILEAAIPVALKKAKPGTAEFRAALRDAIESTPEIAATHGVFNYSPEDHFGHDERSRVLITVENGAYKLIPESVVTGK